MSKNCETCGNKPCLFDVFREEFIETEMWTDAEKVILPFQTVTLIVFYENVYTESLPCGMAP